MPNYENSDPSLTDDINESIDGIRDISDKAKRARDVIDKGRNTFGGKKCDDASQRGGEQPAGSTSPGAGAPTRPKAGPPPSGPSGPVPAASKVGVSAGPGASAGAGAATGTVTGSASAGGATAGAAARGTAATAGASGAVAAGGVIVVIILLLLFWGMFFLPNAAGGNAMTHLNDGEVLGTQGPNDNNEYDWADLDYDRDAAEESKVFLRESKRNQKELASVFEEALEEAIKSAKIGVFMEYGLVDEIIVEYDGFNPNHYSSEHVFKDALHSNPQLLYILCAYSAVTNNFVGKYESLLTEHADVTDKYGDVQTILDLVQYRSDKSIFNQGLGAAELIIEAFKKMNGNTNMNKKASAILATVPNPDYSYGNIVHGASIGKPYIVEEKVFEVDLFGHTITKYVDKTYVKVTIHDLDAVALCEEVFGYRLDDIYDDMPTGAPSLTATYRTTIDDMVTYAGRLLLEASGEDPDTISFAFGSSTTNYIAPFVNMTGNGSQDMVNTALAYYGNVGGYEFKQWYGLSYDSAWCAAFVSYVANQCGYIDAGIIPRFCNCGQGRDWFILHGEYQSAASGYVPKPGDIVFFSKTKDGNSVAHVGIVIGADGKDKVYTIEGNTTNPFNPNATYGVYKKTRSPNYYLYIIGYGTPNYPTTGSSSEGFQSPVGSNWRANVTSEFSRQVDPITNRATGHNGIDIACQEGTSVHASLSGKVIVATYDDSYGYYVKIDHGNGLQTLYAHNSQVLVSVGQTVQAGDIVAKSGATGQSTEPQCHFEVWLNGERVDPQSYLP